MQWSWWNVCNDHDVWIIFDRKKLRANHKTWKANIKISLKRTFFLRRNMCTTKVAWPTTKSMSVVESRPWDYQIVASINSHFSLRFSQVQKKMHANDVHRNICTSTEYKRSFWLRQSLLQCCMPSTLNRKLCIVADHWTRSNRAGKKNNERNNWLTFVTFSDEFITEPNIVYVIRIDSTWADHFSANSTRSCSVDSITAFLNIKMALNKFQARIYLAIGARVCKKRKKNHCKSIKFS